VDNLCDPYDWVASWIGQRGYTIGGFIHILLIIAIVVVLIRIIQGRSPLWPLELYRAI